MRYVGVGRRFVAILVDGVVALLWLLPLGDIDTTSGVRYSIVGGPLLLAVVLWIAYDTAFETILGATPGKLLLRIRVVKADGSRVDLAAALTRSVMRLVDAFPYVVPYLVAAVSVWSTPSRLRVGDRVAGTVVIEAGSRRSEPVPTGPVTTGPPPTAPPPAGLPPAPPPPPPSG